MFGFSLKFEADPSHGLPPVTKYFGNTGDSIYSTNPVYNFTPFDLAGNTKTLTNEVEEVVICWGEFDLQYIKFVQSDSTEVTIGRIDGNGC